MTRAISPIVNFVFFHSHYTTVLLITEFYIYITSNCLRKPSVVIPPQGGIHVYQLAVKPMVWHGCRSSCCMTMESFIAKRRN